MDRVHARRRVGHQSQVVGIRIERPAQARANGVQMTLELIREELDRIPLHPSAPLRLGVQHGPRRRTERAVIEEIDVWIERPVAGEVVSGQDLSFLRWLDASYARSAWLPASCQCPSVACK